MSALEIGSFDWNKLDLYRPLRQMARDGSIWKRSRIFLLMGNLFGIGSRTSAWQLCCLFFCLCSFDSLFIISCRFSFYERNRIYGAGRKAVSQPITIIITEQLCLSIDHANGSFMASLRRMSL